MKIAIYFHTIRYLRPIQIFGRFWARFRRPKPDLNPEPSLRSQSQPWTMSPEKNISFFKPFKFQFLNQEYDLDFPEGWNKLGLDKLWLYNLHYFDDLNALHAKDRREWHVSLMQRWVDENIPPQGTGWEPYPLSLRIVNWIKWTLRGNTLPKECIHSLAIQVRYLSKRLEIHLLGNHLLANAKALVFAGLFFEGPEAEKWFSKGLSLLTREIPEQILPDGGHFERSPMYHSIILEDLLDLINIFRVYGHSVPKNWLKKSQDMLFWLKAMCHPDKEISFFNDSAIGVALAPEKLVTYAQRLGMDEAHKLFETITHLKESGYIRIQKDEAVAILDVGKIGPDYIPGHTHADTLSFELSIHGQRVIVNSGTFCYGSNQERQRLRGTAAHSTVTIDGKDSSEVWGGFRVARRARPHSLDYSSSPGFIRVACSHDGYSRISKGLEHRREWVLDNSKLLVRDEVRGTFNNAVAYFYIHPDVQIDFNILNGRGKLLLPNNKTVKFTIDGGMATVEVANYSPQFYLRQENRCLIVKFSNYKATVTFLYN